MSCTYVLLFFDELCKGRVHLLDSPSGKIRRHKIVPPGVSDRQDLPDSELHMADLITDGISEAALRGPFTIYPACTTRPTSFPASLRSFATFSPVVSGRIFSLNPHLAQYLSPVAAGRPQLGQ